MTDERIPHYSPVSYSLHHLDTETVIFSTEIKVVLWPDYSECALPLPFRLIVIMVRKKTRCPIYISLFTRKFLAFLHRKYFDF